MYAFNKRFEPTRYKGLPPLTWIGIVFALLMWAFSVMCFMSLQSPLLGWLLIPLGGFGAFFAVKQYYGADLLRLKPSRFRGKNDLKGKSLGL